MATPNGSAVAGSRAGVWGVWGFTLAALLVSGAPAAARPTPADATGKTFAIVVGYNGAIDGGGAPLEFADDDALKWAEVLGLFADDVTLLTEVDDATASHWGFRDHGLSVASPPTRTQLRAAFERYNRPGAHIIYVHVAHGRRDVDERGGEGFVKMAVDPVIDPRGRLYRSDLRRELVDRLHPTARLDLVVDSCDAFHLVSRGEDAAARVAKALAQDDLAGRPNVGVILATRGAWQVNESQELQGSYFSLIMRSALLGSADPDLGGVVRYAHIDAALRVAGRTENRPRERFEPWVSPPGGRWGAPLVDWGPRRASPTLRIGADVAGHIQVYDAARGLWASFGKARGHELDLRGVGGRSYHIYPDLLGAGWVWRAAAGRSSFGALTQRTPYLAMARGEVTTPIYQGLLHCKLFEGYALASGWPAPACERDETSPRELRARVALGYHVADAPFRRLTLSHGLSLVAELPLSASARLVGAARGEVAHERDAAPYSTIWGFGLGVGAEVTAFRTGSIELGVSATLGWAPLFLGAPATTTGGAGPSTARWTDGFVETTLVTRVWLSSYALVLSTGLSLDIRPSAEATALDLRWLVRLALEFGT